jgi:hypothetical protein
MLARERVVAGHEDQRSITDSKPPRGGTLRPLPSLSCDAAALNSAWPHQVVLPAHFGECDACQLIHEFCKDLTVCTRGHSTGK